MVEVVVAEFLDRFDHTRCIREQMCAVGLVIDQEPPLPDLNIKPVHRDIQRISEFLGAENVR